MAAPIVRGPKPYQRGATPAGSPQALASTMQKELARVERAQPNARTVRATEDYTVNVLDRVILVDTTAGPVTITLSTAAQLLVNPLTILKVSSDTHAVTIAAATGETVNGVSSAPLAATGDGCTLTPDGDAAWWGSATTSTVASSTSFPELFLLMGG